MLDPKAIDALLAREVESVGVPGVVALAAGRDGLLYQGAAGRASLAGDAPMTVDTIFWITSITKMVTSIITLQLVAEGRIGLDDPVEAVVPELARIQVLDGYEADGTPRLRQPRRAITLRHLLSHSAGFAYAVWNETMAEYHRRTGTPENVVRRSELFLPLVADPGDGWSYGVSTDWVGIMIEALTGLPIDVVTRERLSAPLGMASTGYRVTPEFSGRFADLHFRAPDGSLSMLEVGEQPEGEFLKAGSSLFSTGPDLIRLLQALLRDGELDGQRVLSPEMAAEMRRNQTGTHRAGVLNSTDPELSNDFELFRGMDKRWGLSGLFFPEATFTGRGPESLGGGGMYNTFWWLDPVRGVAGIFLTQIMPFSDARAIDLFYAFETAVYDGIGRAG